MRQTLNRRDFFKVCALGAAAAGAALVAPGRNSLSDEIGTATVCAECVSGCAVKIKSIGWDILDIVPNPAHPLAGCPSGCCALDRLNESAHPPGRLAALLQRSRQTRTLTPIASSAAAVQLAGIFSSYLPEEIAFVLGSFPDHLGDLVRRLAAGLGGVTVLYLPPAGLADGRTTLGDAGRRMFGSPHLPIFDLAAAQMILAFGVTGDEPWVRPSGLTPNSGQIRIDLSPVPPTNDGVEWLRIRSGSEAGLAAALAQAVSIRRRIQTAEDAASLTIKAAALSGLTVGAIEGLVERLVQVDRSLAIPGGLALAQAKGGQAAMAILSLNAVLGGLGRSGGLFLPVDALPSVIGAFRTSTLAEAEALVERIRIGQIKALLVHGCDPLITLPGALNLESVLSKLEWLVSFNSVNGPLEELAYLLLPDRLPLESLGYQKAPPWADRPVLSAIQPVIPSPPGSVSSANLLLAAARRTGGPAAAALPFRDEQEFIAQTIRLLDPDDRSLLNRWQQQGGWWAPHPLRMPPVNRMKPDQLIAEDFPAEIAETETLRLAWRAPTGRLSVARPSVWVHPEVMARCGLAGGQRVRVTSKYGALEAVALCDERLDSSTIALATEPVSQWGGGENRLGKLTGNVENAIGDWAPAGMVVTLSAV